MEFELEDAGFKPESRQFELEYAGLKIEGAEFKLEDAELRAEDRQFKLDDAEFNLEDAGFGLEDRRFKLEDATSAATTGIRGPSGRSKTGSVRRCSSISRPPRRKSTSKPLPNDRKSSRALRLFALILRR